MKQAKTNPATESHSLPSLADDTFRKICERIPGVVSLSNVNTGEYVFVSQAVTKLLGYTPTDFLTGGRDFVATLLHPDDMQELLRQRAGILKAAASRKQDDDETIGSYEYRIRHAKGHYVWVRSDGSVFSRKNGKVEQILNVSIDISDRKKAEAKLQRLTESLEESAKEQTDRLELALEAAEMGIWEVDLRSGKLNWPAKTKKLLGFKANEEITFEKFMGAIHPDDRILMHEAMQKSEDQRPTDILEHRVVWPDGSVHWLLAQGKTIFEHGKPVRNIGAAVNIDARKKAESGQRESEERYQAFVHNSNEGIWRFEVEKPIPIKLAPAEQIKLMYEHAYLAEANDTMARMYGLKSSDGLVGLRLSDLLVKSDPQNNSYLNAFVESGYSLSGIDSHEKDSKGRDKYFRNSLVGVVENGMLVRAWGTQQDITAQHAADKALRKSEERLALALNASQLGIWEWDITTNVLKWSDQLKKIYGLRKRDVVTYEKYLSLVHPQDAKKLTQTIKGAMKTGKNYQIEHRIIHPDGSIHWVLGQGQAVFNGRKPVRMIGTSLNIDERKKTIELEAEKLHLIAERKLLMELSVAKDEFISIASHQLRAPATGVKQYIGMLLEGYAGDLTKKQLEFLNIANESNEREISIINDLLEIALVDSGRLKLKKQSYDMNTLVRQVLKDYEPVVEKRQQHITFAAKGTAMASIDKDRIRMVIENVIDNASKYSQPDTRITVKTVNGAKSVRLVVSDEGVGIDKKDLGRLYEKFSRIENELSTERGGTGLGLYWAKRIVDFHRGSIKVRSEPGVGTNFTITLPK